MLPYQHILLAVDLSQYSEILIRRAQEIAGNCDHPKLSLVHVLEGSATIGLGSEVLMPTDVTLGQALEKSARQQLLELAGKVNIKPQDCYVEVGSVKHSVDTLAQRLKVDLIVIGTHGHHGIEKLLGSRANGILQIAKCDVLAVRVYN